MDATTQALVITTAAALIGNIVMRVFDERKRAQEREEDRRDRAASAKVTAEHRQVMSQKLDANTVVTLAAAEKADVAAQKAEVAAIRTEAIQASAAKIEQQTNGMQDKLIEITKRALEIQTGPQKPTH